MLLKPIRAGGRACVALLFASLSFTAMADVYGRLKLVVENADDEKPLSGVKITLSDTAKVHPDLKLTTGADGTITTDPLEARAWHIVTTADKFDSDDRTFTVVRDTTTEVDILLNPAGEKEKVIKVTANKKLLKTSNTTDDSNRDQAFQGLFPTGGNPQSLQNLLVTTPGMVKDSNGQVHPNGEHNATTIYIQGVQIPGAFQGKFDNVLSGTAVQSLDIQTGGFAPEYGSESAAALNVDLRAGPVTPFATYALEYGTFKTAFGDFSFGGQAGQEFGVPLDSGLRARRFSYFVDLTSRSTANAIEPPQPQIQTDHNQGTSYTGLANLTYQASSRDAITFFGGDNPSDNEIVNRTGLPSSFAQYGQGFGFNGWRNADGSIPSSLQSNPGGLGSGTFALPSQNAAGQQDQQTDHNEFGFLTWRHEFNRAESSLLSFGLNHAGIDTTNTNPLVPSLEYGVLPTDSSIEYNPTIHRNSHDVEGNGSFTALAGDHTFKTGFVLDGQHGEESYQVIPGSQLALDWLANPAVGQPGMLPAGSYEVTAGGAPVDDVYGNQVYQASAGSSAPILDVTRTGYYAAAYAQDTWKPGRKFTLNYGLRMDAYKQDQTTLTNGASPIYSHVDQAFLSPRINAAYAFDARTVLRGSFDRLVTQPPLAEGQLLGTQIKPETLSQFDLSVERQIGVGQSVKAGIYDRLISNQIDTSLLIGQTQMGAYTSVNFANGHTQGFELTYNLQPAAIPNLAAYLSYTNSLAKPSGAVNGNSALYGDAPTYNDHDQLNTISAGANYTFQPSKTNVGLDLYFGSGVESSKLSDDLPRNSRYYLNLSVTQPNVFHNVDFVAVVENLTDNRAIINFESGFSGTRFQQGRSLLVGLKGKF